MRIVHVDTGRELRGGQRQLLLLLRGLRAAGADCSLLARRGSPLFSVAREAGVAVFPSSLGALWRLSKSADLVHVHDARSHTMAALASRAPFVVSRRVAFPVKSSLLSKWKYRKAARYLAVSRFVAAELERSGIAQSQIAVVYDGVETGIPAAAWRSDYPAVALATNDPGKCRILVEEAARLAGIVVKFSSDLADDLQRASMFVYITTAEGLGSAALLAMAMGVPVIGSGAGGMPEALGFGEAGIVTQNDAGQIAAAMRFLRDDSKLANTLIEKGRQRVREHFTFDAMVNGTLESYRRALAG